MAESWVRLLARALELDANAVYANAFWAHYLLERRKDVESAKRHFNTALSRASKSERSFIRGLQLHGFTTSVEDNGLWVPIALDEAFKTVNEIRAGGDELPKEQGNLWAPLLEAWCGSEPSHVPLIEAQLDKAAPADMLSAWLWLTRDTDGKGRGCYVRCVDAHLAERTGNRAQALEIYTSISRDPDDDCQRWYRYERTRIDGAIARLSAASQPAR